MLGQRVFGLISTVFQRTGNGGNTLASEASGLLIQTWLPVYQPIRTNVRDHFPRPSEVIRIKRHGWKKRLSTVNGQKILQRRILKGRHVLSH